MPDLLSIMLDALNAFEETIKRGDRNWVSYPSPTDDPEATLRQYLADIADASKIVAALMPGPRLSPKQRKAALDLLKAAANADNPDSVKPQGGEPGRRRVPGYGWHDTINRIETSLMMMDRDDRNDAIEALRSRFEELYDRAEDTPEPDPAPTLTWTYSQVNVGESDVTHGLTFTGTDAEWADHLAGRIQQGIEVFNAKSARAEADNDPDNFVTQLLTGEGLPDEYRQDDIRSTPHAYVSQEVPHWRTCALCGAGANAKIHRLVDLVAKIAESIWNGWVDQASWEGYSEQQLVGSLVEEKDGFWAMLAHINGTEVPTPEQRIEIVRRVAELVGVAWPS